MRTQQRKGDRPEQLGSLHEHGGADVDRAIHVLRYKSAKYTVEHPLLLGAAMAGAGPEVLAGLSAYVFTDSVITPGSTQVKKVHLTDLRTALDAARSALTLSALSYTDTTINAQGTAVKAAHLTELRNGVK